MHVRLAEPIASSQRFVAPALAARVNAYAAGSDEPLMLRALELAVPIRVSVTGPAGPDGGTRVQIGAERNASLFPVFDGVIRAEAVDPLNARIVMDGDYTVPLGLLGAAADRTVLADVARASLQQFLERMKDEVSMDVLRRDTAP